MKKALSRKNLWNAMPAPVKAAAGRSLAMLPLPLLLGRRFRACYRFLEEAQWWDAERIRVYQTQRVREILSLAYEKTAYYRRTFDAVGFEPGDFKDLADLQGLPTIDKSTVREHLDDMLTVPKNAPSVDYMTTGGSGGTPLSFYINADRSSVEFAHLAQCWARVGYRPGMSMAVLRGTRITPDRTGFYCQHDPLLRQYSYSSFHMTERDMTRYVQHMHRAEPDFVHAYPSSMHTLARFMVDQGLRLPESVRAILLESEPVYPEQRDFIERHFHRRVYSSYGHTEKLVLAGECEQSHRYHVWPTYGYCELLDDELRPVEYGEQGEIVGTGFINRVVPFIRYRTDDFAVRGDDTCSACGRHHLLLDDLAGHRSQEFLVTRGAQSAIVWTALNMHDDTFDGIKEFQFVQDVPGEAELYVVPLSGPARYDLQRMQEHLDRKLNGQITVRIHVCDHIERTSAGKRAVIRQRIPNIDRLLGAVRA